MAKRYNYDTDTASYTAPPLLLQEITAFTPEVEFVTIKLKDSQ